MNKVTFGIVGGGWRSEFYLRIAKALPDRFHVCGMTVRNEEKAKKIQEMWGVPTYSTLNELLERHSPDFVVVSVSWPAAPDFIKQLAERQMPVLSETPPAPDLQGLIDLHQSLDRSAKVQVAEQYQFQPLHAARIALAGSGMLGVISHVQLSVCHGYHAISLMRKLLGVTFENAAIRASKYKAPFMKISSFNGMLDQPVTEQSEQVIAELQFAGKSAVYDFSFDQYFSPIRNLRAMVRGEKGEIIDSKVYYLDERHAPIEADLVRQDAGLNGNLEGYFHKGIVLGGQWIYRNPFTPGRISDDEIAIATCLFKMKQYVQGGPEFYGLADAAQDHYLSLLMNQAAATGQTVISENQPWSR